MALPAPRREVAEEPLPQPRTRQLAVDEEERLPPRSALREPRLDVQAAVVELDLVLPDGPAVRRRDLRPGEDLVRRRFVHRCRVRKAWNIGSLTIRGD